MSENICPRCSVSPCREYTGKKTLFDSLLRPAPWWAEGTTEQVPASPS